MVRLPLVLTIICATLIAAGTAAAAELTAYVGTYTNGDSEGIYLLKFNPQTGAIRLAGLAAKSENPSFLALHPSGQYLYAVNETNDFGGEATGAISAFSIDEATRKLTLLNQMPSGGAAPCHLVVDALGRTVLVANYSGGNVAAFQIDSQTGKLARRSSLIQHHGSSVLSSRQREPHAHSINLDAANRFAVAADLGIDRLIVYAFNPQEGTLAEHGSTPITPGSGPRHFAFHPNGKYAYVINEIARSITAFSYDQEAGELTQLQTISTVPAGHQGGSTAEIRVSDDGKFVFGSNRGHDSIAVFRVEPARGTLTLVEIEPMGGKTPRNFVTDPTGNYLLAEGQQTNNIVVFQIDRGTGELTRTAHEVRVPSPVCIRFANN
jgi:6-phosphogluconolactonase